MTSNTPRSLLAVALLTVSAASLAPSWSSTSPASVAAAPVVRTQPTWPSVASQSDPLAATAGAAYRALAWSNDLGADVESLAYTRLRNEVATEVAARLELPAELLVTRWAAASEDRQLALMAGLSQLGVPYRTRASSPGHGFDCSGFTTFAWSMAGVDLPRISRDQIRVAADRDATTVEPGDLAYYPGHVMMSLGLPGAVIHSVQSGRFVEIEMLSEQRAARLQYGDPTS